MSQSEPIKFLDPSPVLEDELVIIEPEIIDAEIAVPKGGACNSCGSPLDLDDHYCHSCGAVVDTAGEVVEPSQRKYINCKTCGSTIATDPGTRSYRCAFCDSTYVVELEPSQTGRQNPEFIIGFAVSADQAREKFDHWIKDNSWFRPGDLRNVRLPEKMIGIYLPFWSFSMLAESQWSASIGEHWYRTETYTTRVNGKTVTRTRTVTETEWWPLSGNFHRYYSGYLVSASPGLPQEIAEQVMPFDLPALKRFEPYFLAGWGSEEYTVPRDVALAQSKQYYHDFQEANIGNFMPGDRFRGLEASTYFSRINSDLCLLPYYLLTYRFNDQLYRFLINGQTGRAWGHKPYSSKRISIFILIIVIVIAAIVGLISLFSMLLGG